MFYLSSTVPTVHIENGTCQTDKYKTIPNDEENEQCLLHMIPASHSQNTDSKHNTRTHQISC